MRVNNIIMLKKSPKMPKKAQKGPKSPILKKAVIAGG
jgi:hypothetical protein